MISSYRNINVVSLALLLFMASSFSAPNEALASPSAASKDATGVCFRKLLWEDKNGGFRNYYEFVIYNQSSSTANDVRRVEKLKLSSSPVMNSDFLPFKWTGILVSDGGIETGPGPNCSNLPAAYSRPPK